VNKRERQEEMGGVCSTHRRKRNAYTYLGGKPEDKKQFLQPRHRWEGNSIDIKET